jgi:acetone carboxylase gamma subunit
VQQPVCPSCCTAANVRRAEAGLPLVNESDTTEGLYRRQLARTRP